YPPIRAYAQVLVARAADLERKGHTDQAARECGKVLEFAGRLRAAGIYSLETWVANDIQSLAYARLEALDRNSRRPAESAKIGLRRAEHERERVRLVSGSRLEAAARRPAGFPRWTSTEWAGFAMQAAVLAIWILLPASLLGLAGLVILN